MNAYTEFLRSRKEGTTTCLGTVSDFLARIEARQSLNAFIHVNTENALIRAKEADRRFDDGTARPLEGMVIALKDNMSTKGMTTTCASAILKGFKPVYDATVVTRLQQAGAIFIGKTNMDEFAMGSSNENSAFGPVQHPLNAEYVPGGSSGGSTVAVAAGLAHTALGSDTGGSIRQPAALCGVVGVKPTYGRVSRYGLVAFASSLDQIGSLSVTVEDAARVLDVMSGKDEQDATSAAMPPTATLASLHNPLPDAFTVAILSDEQLSGCHEDIIAAYKKSIAALEQMGGKTFVYEMQYTEAFIPTYYVLATAEASSNLSRFDGVRYGFRAEVGADEDMVLATRSQGFGAEVKRRIMLGTYVLSSGYYDAYYTKALKVRKLLYSAYQELFKKADIFLLPTSPTPAFKRGERTADPIAMYLSDIFTVSANLSGNPAISIPAGMTREGLPIGMQLQANHFEEARLFQFAHQLQNALAG